MSEMNSSVRTYRGSSISSTLEEIQRDLGEEALVVSVREVPGGPAWQVWKDQQVEVKVLPPPDGIKQEMVDVDPEENTSLEALFAQVQQPVSLGSGTITEPQLAEAGNPNKQAAAGKAVKEAFMHSQDALDEIRTQLKHQGLDPELMERVFKNVLSTLNPAQWGKTEVLKPHIKQQLALMLKAYNAIRLQQDRVIFLIGPRGCGKTTTTAKLALHFTENLKSRVIWICADTIRAASINEARVYCDSLGVELKLVYTPRELVEAIRSAEGSDVVLVDTPGFNPYMESDVLQVGKLLTAVPGRSTYLLAPASTKEADLEDMAAAFEPFQPDSLVLTKLDETGSYGSIFNFANKCEIPLAYFSSGPDVFTDLRPANPGRLVDALMGDVKLR
jgi:flagellar biosynthesis protein FlhF